MIFFFAKYNSDMPGGGEEQLVIDVKRLVFNYIKY